MNRLKIFCWNKYYLNLVYTGSFNFSNTNARYFCMSLASCKMPEISSHHAVTLTHTNLERPHAHFFSFLGTVVWTTRVILPLSLLNLNANQIISECRARLPECDSDFLLVNCDLGQGVESLSLVFPSIKWNSDST